MVKEYSEKELLDMLPSGWNDITLEKFIKIITEVEVKEHGEDMFLLNLENSINISSVFIGLDTEIIEQLPLQTIKKMDNKLSFLSKRPEPKEVTIYKWVKEIDEPDYDSFIIYTKMAELLYKPEKEFKDMAYQNLPLFIRKICLDKLTLTEINQLPMDEVETGFFLLRKSLRKYLKTLETPLQMIVMKDKLKKKMKSLIHFKKSSDK